MLIKIKSLKNIFFKVLTLILFWFNLVAAAHGQNFASSTKINKEITIQPPLKNLILKEHLDYSLEWLGIPVGTIALEIKEVAIVDDRECYHITGRAFPNRFFSKIYDVDYTVDTYIDTKSFYTYRFKKRRRLNDKVSEIVIDFDREKSEAIYRDKVTKGSISRRLFGFTQDLFSSLYQFRLMDIEEGGSYKIKVLYGGNYWDLRINVNGTEVIEIPRKGCFDVFRTEIDAELSKIILGKRKLTVYFTADSHRIPLRFIMHSHFGPIKGKIREIPK